MQELSTNESKSITIDLEVQTIKTPSGTVIAFDIEPSRKEKLLKGLDPVGLTLKSKDKIKKFEEKYFKQFPWLA